MNYSTAAISYLRTKEAALYFDFVIPLYAAHEIGTAAASSDPWPSGLADSLLPEPLTSRQFRRDLVDVLVIVQDSLRRDIIEDAIRKGRQVSDEDLAWLRQASPTVGTSISDFLSRHDLTHAHVVSIEPPVTHGAVTLADVALTVPRLALVDPDKLSWRQIVDLRSDKDAMAKLRRLRLYAEEHYAGQSLSFMEDDLAVRLHDYGVTVARWGLETRLSALTMLVSSRALASSFAGAILALGLGATPLTALTGAAVLELAGVSLEVVRRRQGLRHVLEDNPISYVAHLSALKPRRTDA